MNNNQLPPISDFLDTIDSDRKINREQALVEIGAVIFSQAIDLTKKNLDQSQINKLETLISEPNLDPNQIIDLYEKSGNLPLLQDAVKQATSNVHTDYIKTHLSALEPSKVAEVLSKYPLLSQLLP